MGPCQHRRGQYIRFGQSFSRDSYPSQFLTMVVVLRWFLNYLSRVTFEEVKTVTGTLCELNNPTMSFNLIVGETELKDFPSSTMICNGPVQLCQIAELRIHVRTAFNQSADSKLVEVTPIASPLKSVPAPVVNCKS